MPAKRKLNADEIKTAQALAQEARDCLARVNECQRQLREMGVICSIDTQATQFTAKVDL